MSGHWARNLDIDLDAVKSWGAHTVISLIEDFEFAEYQITDLGEGVQRRGMNWLHLPIRDQGVPDAKWEQAWSRVSAGLLKGLSEGRKILVHCRGGLGRAGLVTARLLIEQGMSAEGAISRVRQSRRKTIQTYEQEEYLSEIRENLTFWKQCELHSAMQSWALDIGKNAAAQEVIEQLLPHDALSLSFRCENDVCDIRACLGREGWLTDIEPPDALFMELFEILTSTARDRAPAGFSMTFSPDNPPILSPIFAANGGVYRSHRDTLERL